MHRVISPEPEGEKCRTLTWQSCIKSLSSRGLRICWITRGKISFWVIYRLLQLLMWQKQTNKQKCTVGETHTNTEPIWWETILLLPIWMEKSHSNFRWLENQPLCLTKNKIRKTHSYFHSSWKKAPPPPPPPFFFHQQSKIRLASRWSFYSDGLGDIKQPDAPLGINADKLWEGFALVYNSTLFLFTVHQHGITFPFLSDRDPLWTHSNLKTFLFPKLWTCHVFCSTWLYPFQISRVFAACFKLCIFSFV